MHPAYTAYMKNANKSQAAKKGWETRRKNLENYGTTDSLGAIPNPAAELDLATELPTSRLFEAGGMASWTDVIYQLDPDGYRLLRNCAPIIKAINKRGTRIAKLNWTVRGEGARAKAMAEIVEQIHNWTDMIKWLTWGMVEGVRFMQIKASKAREGSEPWLVPDFFMGGRKKFKAGGDIQWDGNTLVQTRLTTGVAERQIKKLPLWQFIVHRPGGGSSPEGDLELGTAAYRLAFSWEEFHKNIDAHGELFGVPIRVFKGKMDNVRPDRVGTLVTDRINRLASLRENKTMMLSDEEMLELIEPKGKGFEDMIEYCRYLEGVIDQLFLDNQLTSSVSDAQRTGDTGVHLAEESESIFVGAMDIAASLNRSLMPWIVRKNPNLPPLADGEMEPYLWPEPAEESDETDDQSIDAESEGDSLVAEATTNPETETEPEAGKEVAALALNGAQITSLQGIVQAVSDGTLPEDTAKVLIRKAFPTFTDQDIADMLDPTKNFNPEVPQPVTSMENE